MADRIPYRDLLPDEQEDIHAWLREHRIVPGRVPVDAELVRDDSAGEWRIPLFWHDADGRMHVDGTGDDVRRVVVRRRELRPLPWPRSGLRMVGPVTHLTIGGIDMTSYVSAIEFSGQRLAVQGGGHRGS